MTKKIVYIVAGLLALNACKIENDIPYPIVEGNIESFAVEGQCAAPDGSGNQAVISTSNRTVTLYVDDTVDLTKLRITQFTVSSEATIQVDSSVCVDYSKFPTAGFETLDNTADTRVNFTNPVKFTLQTYQDYQWTVNVTQIIERNIDVTGQISSVIDTENRIAIIYVSTDTDLSNIQVNTMNLGGASGTVTPDPTTVHDFSSAQQFLVSQGWEDTAKEWTVYVYHSEGSTSTASIFPRTTSATISGNIQSGQTPVISYKETSASNWTELSSSAVTVSGTSYSADITGLTGGTSYQYQVAINGSTVTSESFTTAPATPLTNGGFEDWWSETTSSGRTLWHPGVQGENTYWTTGNEGATIIANSNSVPETEIVYSGTRAACLQTKWLTMKLAAGNLFTGDFQTDGTHGILTLGREFSAFPSTLRMHLKYTTSTVSRTPTERDDWDYMKGQNDTCHVYIALTTEKIELRTRRYDIFNKRASSVIAYGEYQSGVDVSGSERNGYAQIDVPLEYYRTNVTPQYLIIVCSSSKYGNLFVGGESSTMYLDEMELIYE